MKPQNYASWAGSITSEIVIAFQIVNKHELLLQPSKGSVKTRKSQI